MRSSQHYESGITVSEMWHWELKGLHSGYSCDMARGVKSDDIRLPVLFLEPLGTGSWETRCDVSVDASFPESSPTLSISFVMQHANHFSRLVKAHCFASIPITVPLIVSRFKNIRPIHYTLRGGLRRASRCVVNFYTPQTKATGLRPLIRPAISTLPFFKNQRQQVWDANVEYVFFLCLL